MGYRRAPAADRFWAKVDRRGPTECWEWTAFCNQYGYGQLRLSNPMRGVLAHRFSWELHHGPVPAGLMVLHRCDNPPCVNPAHLFLGMQLDNMRDASGKGRAHGPVRQGASNHRAKLTEAQVIELRQRRANGEQLKVLAEAFGISDGQVKQIVYRKSWRNV